MKPYILCLLVLVSPALLSSCVSLHSDSRKPRVISTTTEETTTRSRPSTVTVETERVRSY